MLVLKIAFRNIFRQKRRSFFTALMIAGSFWICSLFVGLTEGSFSNVIDFFTRDHAGHLQIHRAGYLDQPSLQATLDGWPRLQAVLAKDPGVAAAAPRLYASAMAFSGPRSSGVRVIGVDPEREADVSTLRSKIRSGSYFAPGGSRDLLVGGLVADEWALRVGEEVALVSQGADGSVANDLFRVRGILDGSAETPGSRDVYLRLGDAQEFLALEGRFHEVAVRLHDIRRAPEEAGALRTALGDPGLDIQPWQVVEADFYKAMITNKKYKTLVQLIFLILMALGVLNTVLMNLLERIPEYGLMKALGTRPSQISGMILAEMLLLALLSMVPGAAAGWASNAYLASHGLPLPYVFTYGGAVFQRLYGEVSLPVFLVPAALILGMTFVVCLPAAWRVRRLTPMQALHRV